MAQAGYRFCFRYLSGEVGKDLTVSEAAALHAAGLDIGLVFERGATDAEGGSPVGTSYGAAAAAQAKALGVPRSVCLYFAVDFDVQPAQLGAVRSFLAAAAAAVRAAGFRAGVYGGLYCVNGTHDLVDLCWQTLAWSTVNGQLTVSSHTAVFQDAINLSFNGASIDHDRAYANDIGQWAVAEPPPPTPPPPPLEEDSPVLIVVTTLDPTTHKANGTWLVDSGSGAHGGLAAAPPSGIPAFTMDDNNYNAFIASIRTAAGPMPVAVEDIGKEREELKVSPLAQAGDGETAS